MKPEVIIVTGDKVLRVPHETWAAFLQVAALVVDTGDMYPHLERELGEQLLDQVKEVKYVLDDHMSSPS
ncbi:MAG: hypothetical protein EBR82_74345 [Caulobacteraceae bacterium]|nr:hypothetical protein [Caulobacteraceae bacterium]